MKLINWLWNRWYELYYGFKMKPGYEYMRTASESSVTLAAGNMLMESQGWVKIGGPYIWGTKIEFWYERKITANDSTKAVSVGTDY